MPRLELPGRPLRALYGHPEAEPPNTGGLRRPWTQHWVPRRPAPTVPPMPKSWAPWQDHHGLLPPRFPRRSFWRRHRSDLNGCFDNWLRCQKVAQLVRHGERVADDSAPGLPHGRPPEAPPPTCSRVLLTPAVWPSSQDDHQQDLVRSRSSRSCRCWERAAQGVLPSQAPTAPGRVRCSTRTRATARASAPFAGASLRARPWAD
mmetsp:Transcript_80688/g.251601  ORF Transcript_80688/g.251601 Transcript_80688/m.251601 type:complete len:204 (-) Transcript_80688:51-662(-)